MALQTKTGYDIPKDAVFLQEDDAIEYQYNMINSWKNKSEVAFFRYGSVFLSLTAGATAFYLNNYFRYRLRLMHYGRLTTYLSSVVVPTAVVYGLHYRTVQIPITIEKYQCPICLELKSATMQLMGGVAYPIALVPLTTLMMTSRYNTYNIPSLSSDPRAWLKLCRKLYKPIGPVIIGITGFQAFAAAFIAYKEVQEVATVKRRLLEFELELSENQLLSHQ